MGLDRLSVIAGARRAAAAPDDMAAGEFALRHHGRRTSAAGSGPLRAVVLGEVDEVRGRCDPGGSAAGTVLEAFRCWGLEALDRLVGPWSGVLFDGQALHAFRDITGSIPLYVSEAPAGLVLSTDLWALAGARPEGRAADPGYVAHYLNGTFPRARATPFLGVVGVEPGCAATYVDGAWRQRRLATWHVRRIRPRDLREAAEVVGDQLDEAVADRVRGRTSVAVALSGGLDSSNVLASLVRVAPPGCRVTALAVPFSSPRGDERARQSLVAGQLGVPLEWVPVTEAGAVTGRSDQVLDQRQWPPIAGNWFLQDALAAAAVTRGCDAVLDGEDADTAFAGSRAFLPDLLVRGRWRSWLSQAQAYRPYGVSVKSSVRYSTTSLLPPRLDRRVSGTPHLLRLAPLLSPALVDASGIRDELTATRSLHIWAPGRRFASAQLLAGEPEHVSVIAVETSAGGLQRDVDVLHPFQDRRVLELAMGLPWWTLTFNAWRKVVLRELARQRIGADFAAASRKAQLDEVYVAAAQGRERQLIGQGLAAAAQRDDVFCPHEVARLQQAFQDGQEVWPALRAALMALWLGRLAESGTEG